MNKHRILLCLKIVEETLFHSLKDADFYVVDIAIK